MSHRNPQEKSMTSSVCSSSDGTDPAILTFEHNEVLPKDHYAVPSEVATSDSSADYSTAGQQVLIDWATVTMATESIGFPSKEKRNEDVVDWATAKMVEDSPVKEVPIKKKRTRSFGKKLFGGSSNKPRPYKTDKKLDFSMIESPLKSPMPVHLQYDSAVGSESSYGYSQPNDEVSTPAPALNIKRLACSMQRNEGRDEEVLPQQDEDSAPASALSIKSRSIKRLACSTQHNEARDEEVSPSWVKDDDSVPSNPFDSIDPYLAVEENDDESEGENTRASAKSNKSNFSIPLSYFMKKSSDLSWGVSAITETVSNAGSERSNSILQETHWGKEVRSRSRGSATWVPTEEERYQILQGFDHGVDEAKDDDDDESSASATAGVTTEVTRDTGVTVDSEYTNETTSAYTGYYSASDSASSDYTEKSYVTGSTGEASMFSLEVDDSSKSTEVRRHRSRRRASARKRRTLMVKPEQNLLVEVFADLRLLAEDLADEEQGFSVCFRCA